MDEQRLCGRLVELSLQHAAPLPQISDWPAQLDADAWWFPPELLSLANAPPFESLTEPEQKQLARLELINFFSLNVHGERSLLGGLAQHLYGPVFEPYHRYIHHFIDEENKHLDYFASFCTRYAGKVYPDRKLSLPRDCEPGEAAFIFFAKVLFFEEIVDFFNRRLAMDERLPEIVRRINRLHHEDEARHLAFGRAITRELCRRFAPQWSPEQRRALQRYLQHYIESTLREFCNPDVYRDARLVVEGSRNEFARARELQQLAVDASQPLHQRAARSARAHLAGLGLTEPELQPNWKGASEHE
jgi:hypothetical protein